MIKRQILRNTAAGAPLAKPLTPLLGRKVGSALLALATGFAGCLFVAGGQSPKAATISGDADRVAARLVDIPLYHTALAVAVLPANRASDGRAQKPNGPGAGAIHHFQLVGTYPALLGTEPALALRDHGLLAVKPRLTNSARQVFSSPFLGADQPLATGSIGAGAGAELDSAATAFSVSMEGRRAVEGGIAVQADGQLETPSLTNLGEFGGHRGHGANVTVSAQSGNTEPSRACSLQMEMRGTEGVTTRGCGNNTAPTSAQRRSNGEDIVWTAWSVARHAEAGHKQARGNTIDSGYEVLNISPSDVFSAAEFDWKQASVAVTISGLEGSVQNTGPDAIIDLLASRISNAEKTMQNNISADIYSNGTASSGKQIGGLQLLVADTPTSGTVGGINRASFSFWRNQAYSATTDGGSAASASNIQRYMNSLYLRCVRGSDRPDLIVADNNYFQFYWNSLQSIQRITSATEGQAGFANLKYMTADVVFDGGIGGSCPSNHMYMLNTQYIHWRPHRDRNMVALDSVNSINQDAMVKFIVFAGNMTLSNAMLQGVIFQT